MEYLTNEQESQQLFPYQSALMADAEKVRSGKKIAHRTVPYQPLVRLKAILARSRR